MTITSRRWVPAAEEWRDFCTTDPNGKSLGLKGNDNSFLTLIRRHGKRLEELDVLRRSPRRTIIADSERFRPVVFDLLTLGELPDEAAVAAA